MAEHGVLGCWDVPDACSFYLGKGLGAFALGRGYLHVYVKQELMVRLGLSLFVLGSGIRLGVFSAMLLF